MSQISWRKSSYSHDEGTDCVEVAWLNRQVLVRDSKNPAGPMLNVPLGAWCQLVDLDAAG